MWTTRRRFLSVAAGAVTSLVVTPVLLRLTRIRAFAQAIPGSPSFTGNAATSVLGPVSLHTGVTEVRAQFNGSTNFAASLIQPEPGMGPSGLPVTGDYYALFNQIGAFKGTAVALVGVPGDYFLTTSAAGAFQLTVEQPLPKTVTPVQQTIFSGKGQDVSPYFTLPDGISQISCQTEAKQLVAFLYHLDDLGGEPVMAGLRGFDSAGGSSIFDFRDPNNQASFPLALPDSGPYLLYVANVFDNDPANENTWMISFS